MKKYYVNMLAQSNGDHEVHHEDCKYLPALENRKYLGEYWFCEAPVAEAKKIYYKANGCIHCSNSCHTR